MRKEVKKVTGTAAGITFTKQEMKVYGFKIGDVLDLSDLFKIKDELEYEI